MSNMPHALEEHPVQMNQGNALPPNIGLELSWRGRLVRWFSQDGKTEMVRKGLAILSICAVISSLICYIGAIFAYSSSDTSLSKRLIYGGAASSLVPLISCTSMIVLNLCPITRG